MKDIKIYAHEFYYECPKWLQEDRSIQNVKITGDCSPLEVDALLYGMLGYNQIPLTDSPATTLIQLLKGLEAKEIVMSGGLIFQEDDRKIVPSCCCGLEQWKEIVEGIRNKRSPWMGHDPYPGCMYEGDMIIVCSDDIKYHEEAYITVKEDEIIRICYTNQEMDELLARLESDMKAFTVGPLANRISTLAPALEETFCRAWLEYFG